MNKHQTEINFVTSVITHPAGYDLDLFGTYCIRPTDQGVWCVSWEEEVGKTVERTFIKPEAAAEFFVNLRHEHEAGIDIETKLFHKEYERLIFALDVPNLHTAEKILGEIDDYIGMVKVGPEILTTIGTDIYSLTNKPIFLDLKLHDIPATVERTVEAAVDRGIRFVTIHCAQSGKTIEQAVKRTEGTETMLLGVTALTSMCRADLCDLGQMGDESVVDFALRMAVYGQYYGLNGFVCAADSVEPIRYSCHKESILVVPGIRLSDIEGDDQQRIGSPGQVIKNGADYLVVGRPIRDSENRIQTINRIVKQMSQ